MRLPAIRGIIDRRILANFRIDPDTLAVALPRPFRPWLFDGVAIGGICLIRLKQIRPRLLPIPWGLGSENAAHRIAVEWDEGDKTRRGVYIPRRDTNSRLNAWAGGTVFPGVHHHAQFDVAESEDHFSVSMNSDDGVASVQVSGSVGPWLTGESVFGSLQEASRFFEQGSLGYSDTSTIGKFDGLELQCDDWHVESLDLDSIESSYFDDTSLFPPGSVQFDCALLMRGIDHQWHGRPDLHCPGVDGVRWRGAITASSR